MPFHKYKRSLINHLAIMLISGLLLGCQPVSAPKEKIPEKASSPDSLAEREVWKNNKFSMFIHFGVYSELGGVWQGERVEKGYSEQIMAHAGLYSDQYEKAARDFNPRHWNPDSIATLAKDAGMRSVVITAKHHDGFCLFKTNTTSFNIVDYTPWQKDLIAELAKACEKKRLGFGVYFSIIDWHLPPAYPISGHNADPIPPEHHKINLEQVQELMSNYGPISEIWFDMGANTLEQSKELTDLVHRLQPGCMVSGRVGNDQGDFNVMGDNFYPDFRMDVPWQTPASMFDETWGYRSWQERGKPLDKARKKLRSFVNVLSHGGNYLLNIGPKGNGSVVSFESEVLHQIGRWVNVNKEAVYGTSPNPFSVPLTFGEVTKKGNKLFLFVDSIPGSNRLELPGLKSKIVSARFLGSGIPVNFEQKDNLKTILWTDPAMADPMELPVVEVTLEELPDIKPESVIESVNEELVLTPQNATPIRSYTGSDYYTLIPSTTGMTWNFQPPSENYEALIYFSAYEKDRNIELTSQKGSFKVKLAGKEAGFINLTADSVSVSPAFRSRSFTGGLSDVHINVKATDQRHIDSAPWHGPDEINADGLAPLPRTAHYYFIEIESENDQQHSFTFSGNDGLQVWLNGHDQLLQRNQKEGSMMACTLVLSLKKGKNVLLVKNYNRHGTPDRFDIKSNPGAKWYTTRVSLQAGNDISSLTLKASNPVTPHAPIDLPNISLEITPLPETK